METTYREYEEADNAAQAAWVSMKSAHARKEMEAFQRAVDEFSEAMEEVYKAWPPLVEALGIDADTPESETSFLAGYAEAKGYGLPHSVSVRRGDHVVSRVLYRMMRMLP